MHGRFGAKPGNADPFGLDAGVTILVDPDVYAADWVLFCPALTTATVQVRRWDLKRIFETWPIRTLALAPMGGEVPEAI